MHERVNAWRRQGNFDTARHLATAPRPIRLCEGHRLGSARIGPVYDGGIRTGMVFEAQAVSATDGGPTILQ